MAARGRTLTVYLAADTRGAVTQVDSFATKLSRTLVPALSVAAAAAGAFAVKLAGDAVDAAVADEQAMASLARTLDNVGASWRTDEVEAFVGRLSLATGVADDELRPAFDRLVRSTKDVGTAQSALSLALDAAAASGRPLESVANALGRAYDGNTTSLKRLGLGLSEATLATKDMALITAELARLTAGQAATAAATYRGQLNRLSVAADEAKEKIGYALLRALSDVNKELGGSNGLTDAIDESSSALENFITGMGLAAQAAARTKGQSDGLWQSFTNLVGVGYDISEVMIPGFRTVRQLGNTLLATGEAANVAAAQIDSASRAAAASAARWIGLARAVMAANMALARNAEADRYTALAVDEYGASVSYTGGTLYEWLANINAATAGLVGSSGSGGSGGQAGAVETVNKKMLAAIEVTQRHITKLDAAIGRLEAAKAAWQGYSDAISGALSGDVDVTRWFDDWQQAAADIAEADGDLAEALANGDADLIAAAQARRDALGQLPTLADYLTGRATAANDWAAQLATIPGLDPNSPGAQALVQQLASLGSEAGPAFMQAFGASSYNDLASLLSTQQATASGTAKLFADYFYGAGVESATQLVTALADQVEKDEKRLRRIGRAIGQPIGEEIKRAITEALSEAYAAIGVPSGGQGSRSSATYSAAPITVNVQAGVGDPAAIARTIEATLARGNLRRGL